jgi:hypothetical protein
VRPRGSPLVQSAEIAPRLEESDAKNLTDGEIKFQLAEN